MILFILGYLYFADFTKSAASVFDAVHEILGKRFPKHGFDHALWVGASGEELRAHLDGAHGWDCRRIFQLFTDVSPYGVDVVGPGRVAEDVSFEFFVIVDVDEHETVGGGGVEGVAPLVLRCCAKADCVGRDHALEIGMSLHDLVGEGAIVVGERSV